MPCASASTVTGKPRRQAHQTHTLHARGQKHAPRIGIQLEAPESRGLLDAAKANEGLAGQVARTGSPYRRGSFSPRSHGRRAHRCPKIPHTVLSSIRVGADDLAAGSRAERLKDQAGRCITGRAVWVHACVASDTSQEVHRPISEQGIRPRRVELEGSSRPLSVSALVLSRWQCAGRGKGQGRWRTRILGRG